MSKLFTSVIPSLFVGALLFGSTLTGAQPAPAPPAPPSPPTALPPKPPKAPKPPKIKADVHIDLGQIDQMVDQQIENALESIGDNEQIPPQVRQAMKQRLEKLRIKVKKRLSKMTPADMEALGEELGKMGDEIGEEMDQFGKDMEKWGKDFEKHMAKRMAGKNVWVFKGQHDVDVDEEDDLPGMDSLDDMNDVGDAMKDLGNVKLDTRQRDQLKQLRADSEAKVARAKADLGRAEETLRQQLESGNASEAQISQSIDNVSRLEADIRKARIIAWVKARGMLDEKQRQRIESAARGRSH
jgi:hypothetical protein